MNNSGVFKNVYILFFLITIMLFSAGQVLAEDTEPPEGLGEDISMILKTIDGDIGISVWETRSDTGFSINGDEKFFLGSLTSLPVMVTYFDLADMGEVDPKQRVIVNVKDRVWNGHTLSFLSSGSNVSLEDLCRLMVAADDYTAGDLLINAIGLENVNPVMDKTGFSPECLSISLNFNGIVRVMFGLTDRYYRGYSPSEIANHIDSRNLSPLPDVINANFRGINYCTPNAMTSLMAGIAKGHITSRYACNRMLMILRSSQKRDLIPAMIPSDITVANKSSIGPKIMNDTAIINGKRTVLVITILGKNINDDPAQVRLKYSTIANLIYNYYDKK